MLGVGLGLGTGLFPLLSLYLGGEVICFKRKKRHLCLNCFWSSFHSYHGPQLTEGKLVLSFSWELEPSSLREGTRW